MSGKMWHWMLLLVAVAVLCVGGAQAAIIWDADFESYTAGGQTVTQADESDDEFFYIKTADMTVKTFEPDISYPFRSDMAIKVEGLAAASSDIPPIKIGNFDNPAFGDGNGSDVLIVSSDVYAPQEGSMSIYAMDTSGGAGGGGMNILVIPAKKLVRLTCVVNKSANTINLPDFDEDGTVDTNEQLASDCAVTYYRTVGGSYVLLKTLADITVDIGGLWWRYTVNKGEKVVYYDNFYASNSISDTVSGTNILELLPDLREVDSGLTVTNEATDMQATSPETYVVGINRTPYETTDTIEEVTDLLAGLTAVTAKSSVSGYKFKVSEDARGYFAMMTDRGAQVPDGWKLFREGAVKVNYRSYYADIYYKDFDADTSYTVKDDGKDISMVCLGFKALDTMELRDVAITSIQCKDHDDDDEETWVLRTTENLAMQVHLNNPTDASISKVKVRWKFPFMSTANTYTIQPLATGDSYVNLGMNNISMPEGVHWMTAELLVGDDAVKLYEMKWPVVCVDKPAARQTDMWVGAYDKTDASYWHPIKKKIYYHGVFWNFARNKMNVVVAGGFYDVPWALEYLDLAESYDLKVIQGITDPTATNKMVPDPNGEWDPVYTHSAIISYKVGDEPVDQDDIDDVNAKVAAIEEYYDKPIYTCMIGESVEDTNTWHNYFWDETDTEIRVLRHYPIRKGYDLVNWATDKMEMSPEAGFEYIEEMNTLPWWYVMQVYGKGKELDGDWYWRFPTKTEQNALAHLALANGAGALIGFSMHPTEDSSVKYTLMDADLVETVARDSTKPIDAVKDVATLMGTHGALVKALEKADFTVGADDTSVTVVARRDPATGVDYVYVVNRDAEDSVTDVTITISLEDMDSVENVYTGTTTTATDNGSEAEVTITLAAGEGQLWRLDHNFHSNWSFEIDSDSDGVPDDWYPTNPWPANASIDSTTSTHGSKSLKMVAPCDVVKAPVVHLNQTTVRNIRFTAKSKSVDAAGGAYYVQIFGRYMDDEHFSFSTTVSGMAFSQGTHGWETKTFLFEPTKTVKYVRMQLHEPGTGTAWWDEVICHEE
jgi:hypothetical protein